MSFSVKVGILSDTHGHLDERIATLIADCDFAIHAGDICGAHILEQLSPRIDVVAVAGNNDYPSLWHEDETDVVSALPKSTQLQLPGGTIIIEHGHRLGNHPDHDQFRWDHAEAKLVVYGHTHKRIVDQTAEPWVVNPGAAGKARTHGGPSCLILHASETDWQIETVVFAESKAA
ncbi:MAG: metallophosphatase family protein [Gammaproteobacteria bacterium]|nr:metallophosphatase family protein [Gammaproteobacteria bacterium]MCW8923877.1 metallophosphatase family protein [Gammaproteobacteria bacterium]